MIRTSGSWRAVRQGLQRPGAAVALLGALALVGATARAQPRPAETPTVVPATPIEFTEVPPAEWPPVVTGWLQARRQRDQPATGVVHDGPYSYLIATAGAQPSSGYAMRFTGVRRVRERIVATVVLSPPPRGSAVLTVIRHPVAVARIERTDLPVLIRSTAKSRL